MCRVLAVAVAGVLLASCASYPTWLPASGPSLRQVHDTSTSPESGNIQLVNVDEAVTRKLQASRKRTLFSEVFANSLAPRYAVGPGDVIEISLWEAPPAMLFGANRLGPAYGQANSQMTTLPEQMISSEGTVSVPFAGHVKVAGQSPQWVETRIAELLKGKANQPQVMVRVTRNAASNVTVVGEVATSTRVPLTAKHEQLLDVLAAAGGVRQPINKITLQITRGTKVQALPLETVIADPNQNIVMLPGDLVTALYQPYSFTVLGATGKNDEIAFEAEGITLAQALARSGGLNDARSDARAVFVFRFEDKQALEWKGTPATTSEGRIPVVYQLDLTNRASLFLAQRFRLQDKDMIYVSNSPAAELQKFLNTFVTPIVDVDVVKQAGGI